MGFLQHLFQQTCSPSSRARNARGDPPSATGGLPRCGFAFARNDAAGMFSEKGNDGDIFGGQSILEIYFHLVHNLFQGRINRINLNGFV
jgi:hypothetical protein